MGFSRQEDWSGLPFPSPGDLPNPGIEPMSPKLQADALSSEPPGNPEIVLDPASNKDYIHKSLKKKKKKVSYIKYTSSMYSVFLDSGR